MRRFLALVLFAATVLCGCTRVHSSGGMRNAWTIPGVLRIAQREDPDNLNLLLGTETVDIDISAFWGAYLFRWSDRNELVPELATVEPTHSQRRHQPKWAAHRVPFAKQRQVARRRTLYRRRRNLHRGSRCSIRVT